MPNRKLFVDDERFPVDDTWDIARSFHEAIYLLERNEYDLVSLDHDIQSFYGNREMTGRDVLNWLIDRKINAGWQHVPAFIEVHSQNFSDDARPAMEASIIKYWLKY